jgi:GGDEF domain-containing protein
MSYGAALAAALSSCLLIFLCLVSARTINDLEGALRGMSLTDPLTDLQNRRGFYLLGEQALQVARRNDIPMTVLFFDMDGLKTVNDTQGHDVGSQLIVKYTTKHKQD